MDDLSLQQESDPQLQKQNKISYQSQTAVPVHGQTRHQSQSSFRRYVSKNTSEKNTSDWKNSANIGSSTNETPRVSAATKMRNQFEKLVNKNRFGRNYKSKFGRVKKNKSNNNGNNNNNNCNNNYSQSSKGRNIRDLQLWDNLYPDLENEVLKFLSFKYDLISLMKVSKKFNYLVSSKIHNSNILNQSYESCSIINEIEQKYVLISITSSGIHHSLCYPDAFARQFMQRFIENNVTVARWYLHYHSVSDIDTLETMYSGLQIHVLKRFGELVTIALQTTSKFYKNYCDQYNENKVNNNNNNNNKNKNSIMQTNTSDQKKYLINNEIELMEHVYDRKRYSNNNNTNGSFRSNSDNNNSNNSNNNNNRIEPTTGYFIESMIKLIPQLREKKAKRTFARFRSCFWKNIFNYFVSIDPAKHIEFLIEKNIISILSNIYLGPGSPYIDSKSVFSLGTLHGQDRQHIVIWLSKLLCICHTPGTKRKLKELVLLMSKNVQLSNNCHYYHADRNELIRKMDKLLSLLYVSDNNCKLAHCEMLYHSLIEDSRQSLDILTSTCNIINHWCFENKFYCIEIGKLLMKFLVDKSMKTVINIVKPDEKLLDVLFTIISNMVNGSVIRDNQEMQQFRFTLLFDCNNKTSEERDDYDYDDNNNIEENEEYKGSNYNYNYIKLNYTAEQGKREAIKRNKWNLDVYTSEIDIIDIIDYFINESGKTSSEIAFMCIKHIIDIMKNAKSQEFATFMMSIRKQRWVQWDKFVENQTFIYANGNLKIDSFYYRYCDVINEIPNLPLQLAFRH